MLTVSRVQVLKPNRYKLGDRVHIYLGMELYTATAIKDNKDEGAMLFMFDTVLQDKRRYIVRYLDRRNSFKKTFEETDLFKFLKKLINKVPLKIRKQMVPFDNGNYFDLLSTKDVTGSEAIPYLTISQKRLIKFLKDRPTQYWLKTPTGEDSPGEFDYIDSRGIPDFSGEYASTTLGICPIFKLKNK